MSEAPDSSTEPRPVRLREALRQARIEAADRTGVVVDLRDAEVARLEILNDALDPLFNEIPGQIDLFDRGISQGETPRLWIDIVAHVVMGRDKRQYRFVQDTRKRRMVERERAFSPARAQAPIAAEKPRQGSRVWTFALGFVLGALSLFGVALYESLKPISF